MATFTIGQLAGICDSRFSLLKERYAKMLRNPASFGVFVESLDRTKRYLQNLAAGKILKNNGDISKPEYESITLPEGGAAIIQEYQSQIADFNTEFTMPPEETGFEIKDKETEEEEEEEEEEEANAEP